METLERKQDVTTAGVVIPSDTYNTCCVCGKEIPETDYRSGKLHDGPTAIEGGGYRFVHRQAHIACHPQFKKLLW